MMAQPWYLARNVHGLFLCVPAVRVQHLTQLSRLTTMDPSTKRDPRRE